MTDKTRPTGVTVLAILAIIGSIFSLLGAVFLFILTTLITTLIGPEIATVPGLGGVFTMTGGFAGGVLLVQALLGFVLAYGLWTGKGWAWILGIALSILWLILALIAIFANPAAIVGIIVNGLILYYLTRPHVKEWFGRV